MDYVPNRWFAPWLYNRAVDGIAAISQAVARALVCAGVPHDRIAIIPSGVDCNRFAPPAEPARQQARAALGLQPGDIAIGTIGALVPRKGHHILIDAMALACRNEAMETARGRLHCFIAGGGPLQDELAHRIVHNDLAPHVSLLGPIKEPVNLLNALDIFVMPSLNEGMGVAALEAAAAGLPVVASAVGGLPEVVDNKRTGILVEPGEPAKLAEAICRLAADYEGRIAMGGEARTRAIQNWSIELMANRTLQLYYACLNNPQRFRQRSRMITRRSAKQTNNEAIGGAERRPDEASRPGPVHDPQHQLSS
jgi:glycosyltransferase involved in cell wall biosynthesis